jgi:hypothetical protein
MRLKGGEINPKGIYGLHAVIIKKPIELEEAKRIAKDIIKDNTKSFFRETKQSFRFRNISKQKFIPKTFRTKKIKGKPISLVFGELKTEYEHLKGEGLMDFFSKVKNVATKTYERAKDFFSPKLDDYSKTSKTTLNKYGNIPVESLVIYRTPIKGIFNRIINFISLGKWDELRQKYGFDNLFHLALVATVRGKNVIIEKNEVVNVSTSYRTDSDTQVQNIPLSGKVFTINEMLETARRQVGDHTFFDYDAFNNNCQFFIKYLLEAMGLYTQSAKEFLFQDLKKIYEELPSYVPSVIKGITKTGAVVSKLTGQGEGEQEEECEEEYEGGSKASGFIQAIMAGKNKTKPSQFKKFNKRGFDPETIGKASGNVIERVFTKPFYNYVISNPERYYIKDEFYYDLPLAFSDFIDDLPEDSKEYKELVKAYKSFKGKPDVEEVKPKRKYTKKPKIPKGVEIPPVIEELEGEGKKKTKLDMEKKKLKLIGNMCKDGLNKLKKEIVDIRSECNKGKSTRKENIKELRAKKQVENIKLTIEEEPDIILKENKPEDIDIEFKKPKTRPETIEDLFSATKFGNLNSYLWATKELPLYLAHNTYSMFYILYLMDKYKQDCLIVGSSIIGTISWNYTNDYKGAEKIDPEPELIPNVPFEEYFKKVEKCRENNVRFVILPISLQFDIIPKSKIYDREYYHANIILIDLKNNTAEYYEPHGEYSSSGNKIFNNVIFSLQAKLAEIFNNYGYNYLQPSMTCMDIEKIPKEIRDQYDYKVSLFDGLQGMEVLTERSDLEKGYCKMWSILYINLRLEYPDLNPRELNKAIFEIFKYHPETIVNFLRAYSDNLSKYLIDIVFKKVLTEEELTEFIKELPNINRKPKDKNGEIWKMEYKIMRKLDEFIRKVAGDKKYFEGEPVNLLKGISKQQIITPTKLELDKQESKELYKVLNQKKLKEENKLKESKKIKKEILKLKSEDIKKLFEDLKDIGERIFYENRPDYQDEKYRKEYISEGIIILKTKGLEEDLELEKDKKGKILPSRINYFNVQSNLEDLNQDENVRSEVLSTYKLKPELKREFEKEKKKLENVLDIIKKGIEYSGGKVKDLRYDTKEILTNELNNFNDLDTIIEYKLDRDYIDEYIEKLDELQEEFNKSE